MRLLGLAGLWALLALAGAAHFVFETAVVPSVADPALVVGGALASALLLVLVGDRPRRADLAALGGQRIALALGAGALGLAVSPALVVVNRYSDVPPGAVVAFWITAVWGLLLIAASALSDRLPTRAAGGLVAVVGCMGILGSWERPSSFSLLVRYPAEEIAFVVAGVAWVAFVVIVAGLARTHGSRAPYSLAAFGGVIAALGWALPASGWEFTTLVPPSRALPAVLLAGLVTALTVHVARRGGAHLPGVALLTAPALITALLAVEQSTGVFGPRPIILDEAAWGSVVVAAGIAVAVACVRPGARGAHRALRVLALSLGVVSLVAALYALAQPGVAVAVRGTTGAGAAFAADFTMRGFQTVGGWMALAAALLALGAWIERPGRGAAALALLSGLALAGAYATLRFTPLHTWMSWIPAEVQHDYGTEFASITFSPVATSAQVVGIVGACSALAVVLVWRSLSMRGPDSPSGSHAGGR